MKSKTKMKCVVKGCGNIEYKKLYGKGLCKHHHKLFKEFVSSHEIHKPFDPSPMTNWDKWQSYTSSLSSPQNFVDWSWLFMISASLQRRVWIGPDHQTLFPNMYVILVGPPGVGKGLCIKEVISFLKHWKLGDIIGDKAPGLSDAEQATAQALLEGDMKRDHHTQNKNMDAEILGKQLIPVAPDATTYEALVLSMGKAYRHINYPKWSEKEQKNMLGTYGHSSLCFTLAELSSLLRKRSNDTVNYLLGLYDCPLDYEYVTISREKDRVRRGCINFLAGTTPSFIQSTFDEKLTDEGLSSRTFHIYASKNRMNQMWIPSLTPEQEQSKIEILNHIKKLTKLYGRVQITDEARDFMQEWWDDHEKNRSKRSNQSMKMVPYYARKNIHVSKVAMAHHFGESTEMSMGLDDFKWAIAFTAEEEKRMHLALTMEGNNPQAKIARRLVDYLRTGKKNFVELLTEFYAMTDRAGLEEVLGFLEMTDQVKTVTEHDDTLDTDVVYWRTKE